MTLEIKNDVPTRRTSFILDKAKSISNDPEATIASIEMYMRKLYFYETVDEECIKVYLQLEHRWKILTKFQPSIGPVFKFTNNQTSRT
jgi:hypothetical protein